MSLAQDVVRVASQGIDTVKGAFAARGSKLKELAEVDQKADADARALKVALDAAQKRVDEIEAPHKELRRVQEEMYNHGLRVEQARGAVRNWLQDHPTDELARFQALLARLGDKIRVMDGPDVKLKTNFITSAQTITNLAELERWHVATSGPPAPEPRWPGQRLPSALEQARLACTLELWKLGDAEQRTRISELRAAIVESFKGTPLANELG